MEEYTKVYVAKSGRSYRYNISQSVLEYISLIDLDFDENDNPVEAPRDIPEVVDCYGLSRDNWNESPEYWVEEMDRRIEEEVQCLMNYM